MKYLNRRPAITIGEWGRLDQHGRNLVRRNYRWLRERDVSPDVARIVLDSTMRAVRL